VVGGNSTLDIGGNSYGSATTPTALGSGGGGGGKPARLERHRSRRRSNQTDRQHVPSRSTAPFSPTVNRALPETGGGGGAAGSVWIVASTVSGAGQITANGGNSDGKHQWRWCRRAHRHHSALAHSFQLYFFRHYRREQLEAARNYCRHCRHNLYSPRFSPAAGPTKIFPATVQPTAMQSPSRLRRAPYANAAVSACERPSALKFPPHSIWSGIPRSPWRPIGDRPPQNCNGCQLFEHPDSRADRDLRLFGRRFHHRVRSRPSRILPAASAPNPDHLELEVLNDGNTQAEDAAHDPHSRCYPAFDDACSVITGSTLNVAAPGVLINDTEISAKPLTAQIATNPAHGQLALNSDGSFSYTPAAHFIGIDSFTYAANNGTTSSLPATVTIAVNKTTLTVKAGAVATVYGSPLPSFTYTFSGFVNGDTPADVSGAPAFATPATVSSPVGTYAIVPSLGTLASNSYTFALSAARSRSTRPRSP